MNTKGISLHIGLKYLGRNYPSMEPLPWAVNDAVDMQKLCKNQGFTTQLLTDNTPEIANIKNVTSAIVNASKKLKEDDIFCITFSGHGDLKRDTNGDEPTGSDQTWCLYDGQLIDDHLKALWSLFKPGVRILVISDSCFSGSIIEFVNYQKLALRNAMDFFDALPQNSRFKPIEASVKLMAATQDYAKAIARKDKRNSLFTEELLQIWNNGHFQGGYEAFFQQIKRRVTAKRPSQVPNMMNTGRKNPSFDKQKPFTI